MPRPLLTLALLLPLSALAADTLQVNGRILQRLDGRPGEGVAEVLVSNGRELVRTDAEGRYAIELAAGDTLFVIKPAGFRAVFDTSGRERFWRHHFPAGSPPLRYGGIAATAHAEGDWDFALMPQDRPRERLRVLVFGDPQPKSLVDVGYFERDIIEPIQRTAAIDVADPAHGFPRFYFKGAAADLGLTLGDVVDDDLTLLPAVQAATARLGVPWLTAAGNHDLDFDAAHDDQSLLSFRNLFGPDSLAWEEPEAAFVVLDNVIYRPGQRPRYIGGLREDQFAFLAAYLATLDPTRRLVIAAHIHFFNDRPDREDFRRADRERLFALLAPFERALLLTAHGHVQRHVLHGPEDGWHGSAPLHEYNVGAACGGYWSGVKDAEGIPDAIMADGTPNGWARVDIDADGGYALRWFAARDPDDRAIALHAPKVLRRGAWPGAGLYANVFMGLADSVVEWRLGEGEWRPMQRVLRADPRVLAINLADDAAETLRGYDRTPEAQVSTHLWRVALPTDLEPGEHRIEVRSVDRWRGELRAQTRYRLVEVEP